MDDNNVRNPWVELWDAPWLGIGVGIVIGAYGSLLSVKWLAVTGWAFIAIQIFRHDFRRKGRIYRVAFNVTLCSVVAFVMLIAWIFIKKPPEPLTKSDIPTPQAIEAMCQKGVELGFSKNAIQDNKSSDKSGVVNTIARKVRSAQQNAPFLSGMPDSFLADIARNSASLLESRKASWEVEDDNIGTRFLLQMKNTATEDERNKLKDQSLLSKAAARAKFEREMRTDINNANLVRKAMLQKLNEYPPTTSDDQEEDKLFENAAMGSSDPERFLGQKAGKYLLTLADRLVPR